MNSLDAMRTLCGTGISTLSRITPTLHWILSRNDHETSCRREPKRHPSHPGCHETRGRQRRRDCGHNNLTTYCASTRRRSAWSSASTRRRSAWSSDEAQAARSNVTNDRTARRMRPNEKEISHGSVPWQTPWQLFVQGPLASSIG